MSFRVTNSLITSSETPASTSETVSDFLREKTESVFNQVVLNSPGFSPLVNLRMLSSVEIASRKVHVQEDALSNKGSLRSWDSNEGDRALPDATFLNSSQLASDYSDTAASPPKEGATATDTATSSSETNSASTS